MSLMIDWHVNDTLLLRSHSAWMLGKWVKLPCNQYLSANFFHIKYRQSTMSYHVRISGHSIWWVLYMNTWVYAYMCICMFICKCVSIHICVYLYVCMCIYVYTVCVYVHTCVCVCVRAYMCMCICEFVYANMYLCVHHALTGYHYTFLPGLEITILPHAI